MQRLRDGAASGVIAILLLIAVTVAIAATLLFWTTRYTGSATPSSDAIGLRSEADETAGFERNLTVAAATGSARWEDVKVVVDGVELDHSGASAPGNGQWGVWDGPALVALDSPVLAGQKLEVDLAATTDGETVVLVDRVTNSILASIALV